MGPRILVTGATGFIGGRVAATAAAAAEPAHLRLLARRPTAPPTGPGAGPEVETVPGDLRDPASLRRACEGVDTLIHCASAIGADEEVSRAVNDEGTRALVDAAVRAGVTRIVSLSTASVHGRGPFRAAAPGTLPLAPGSATSRTRAAGERYVLDAGGTVLRPHLVYGTGDRQLMPGIVRLLAALPGPLDGGGSLHSLIDVDSLARALLDAALSPRTLPGPYYVNHPEPVPVAELLGAGEALLAGPSGTRGPAVDIAGARALLAELPFAQHHLAMLATDHWFEDDRPWRDWGRDPGPGFAARIADHTPWYRGLLDHS
ncbi:NAD-dependent epimerase/dehydratase family protein [Streptomyces tanashiensis]|uniref:NAD-dependent epimerase/dehydratase family protein n=1 Tax=Streptomyces tanashiensis TaxID=67367 RepID=A0ABY6QUM8_9ACTN|nr:NAD-dependent epimerase/dehydratase family protein [Streptomyces tanashiensis]UZX20896.1 NAD-dependent epimerase/dehydratase family protein [Streptomyces tanashiensis]